MSDMAIDMANRHVRDIRGLVRVASDLLGSDMAENIYRCSVAENYTEKTVVSDSIVTSYEMNSIIDKFKYLSMMLFFPLILVGLFLYAAVFYKKIPGKKYKCGVRIYNGDYGFGQGRSVDFVVGNGLNKEDVLFCIETNISDIYNSEFVKRGYTTLPLKYCLVYGDIIRVIRFWPSFLFNSISAGSEDIRTSLDIMYKYILWTGFVKVIDVDVYLVYGDYVPTSILRSIIFSRYGRRLWYYSNSYAYWYVYTGGENKINPFLAFYSCDKAIAWGRAQAAFISRQSEDIKSVETVGCLWTQLINKVKHTGIVISVFDTSYGGGYSPVTFDELAAFLKDIIRLAEERPDITFLYKTKVPGIIDTEKNKLIKNLYDRMLSMSNVKVVTDGIKAMAVSDLIIAIPFTSPAMEAWAAGMKAIYHNVGETRSDLCDRIPNVVSYNYDELKVLVDYWLDDVNGIILNMFSQQYILGEIDTYMDCKGIDRLRKMILDEKSTRT